jgi:formylglycine-generating enzyme required for sulfatase activity
MTQLGGFVFAASLVLIAAGCEKETKPAAGQPGVAASGTAAASASVSAGPSVTIPAGTLRAGTYCGGTPRVTTEELVGDSIALGEFSIDAYPYPNDPTQPARVNVSREEAAGLCAAAGKRLCSELEWERACKGPSNATFESGPSYNPSNCKRQTDLLPGKRPKCVSAFGVKDLHGLVFEWTSSPWGRGTSGDLATVRGGFGPSGMLQARCANGQSRPPSTQAPDVGFRCCSGPANSAQVNLSLHRQPPIVDEPAVEANLAAAMLRAMPADHRAVPDAEVRFVKLWRWHPRDNEELLIARWSARPNDRRERTGTEIAVFKVCGTSPSLVARMRGPVESLGSPGAGANAQMVSLSASTGSDRGDVKLSYSYGSVHVDQPAWLKAGNTLATAEPASSAIPRLRVPIPRPRPKPR